MRTTLFSLASLASVAALSTLSLSAAASDSSMRPGLWEVRTSSDLLKLVPHIPANQMQTLMGLAKQYGFDMPDIQNGAAISKTCITPAMASQKDFPDLYQHQSGCATKNASLTGNRYRMDFVCDSPRVNGRGSAEGTFTSKETFAGRTAFRGVIQGAAVNEQADLSGRWIDASCGTVKPPQ